MLFAVSAIAHLQAAKYKNPIIAEDAPDPSIIKGNDGYYYLFSTAEHVYRSTDMVHWKYLRQVFDGGKRPTFVEGVDVYWAPCVTKQDGRYVMYFALSKWGGGKTASIGCVLPGGRIFPSGNPNCHKRIHIVRPRIHKHCPFFRSRNMPAIRANPLMRSFYGTLWRIGFLPFWV